MMANITFLSFLLFSMCHSIHVAVNTWLNCSFFTLIVCISEEDPNQPCYMTTALFTNDVTWMSR